MVNKIKGLLNEEAGQGMTEYGLVLGLIAVAVVTTLVALRTQIITLFQNAGNTVGTGITEMSKP
jgi:pilus assembly protein Flp/PilA